MLAHKQKDMLGQAQSMPVRRCLGRRVMMASSSALKPISRSLSASSRISISSRFRSMLLVRFMMSASLPGVPIRILPPSL